jgi:hypothetical protein
MRRQMLAIRFLTATAVVAATVAACSSSSTKSSTSTTATASAATVSTINAPLSNQPSGTVALSWDPQTKNVSANAMHIHQGSCAAQGDVLVSFPDVTANGSGVIDTTVTSSQPSASGLTAGTLLNIHLASSQQLGNPGSLGYMPISCADVNPAASETLTMAPPPQPGQHPQASVQLTYDPVKKTLSVAVTASGLVPGTAHAEHLHRGSCASPKPLPAGKLEYPLDDLVASPTGTAQETKVFPNVDQNLSGWYLNIHLGSSDQLFQNGQPTLYFQPIICGEIGK